MRTDRLVALLALILVSVPAAARAETIFVDARVGGDGSAWTTAHATLGEALARATPGDEVWVAEGVYVPGADVDATFFVPSGVAVYGGFAGVETEREARDPSAHVTVMSGDVGRDDAVDVRGVTPTADAIVGGNARHVITIVGAAIRVAIDGVVVTGGDAQRADGAGEDGAGIAIVSSTVLLRGVEIRGNRAGTDARNGSGAGVHCLGAGAALRVEDASITDNRADLHGGGIAAVDCRVELARVDFARNVTTVDMPSQGCDFGTRGGGAMYLERSPARVEDARFEGDRAGCGGGAMFVRSGTLELDRAVFAGETATAPPARGGVGDGGAILAWDAVIDAREVVFVGGVATDAGGAVSMVGGEATFVNATWLGSTASAGAMVAAEGGARVEVHNAIVVGHGDAPVSATDGAEVRVTHSLVDTMFEGVEASVVGAPRLLDGATDWAAARDFRLAPSSPGIGAASMTYVTSARDLDGAPRVVGERVDVGATQSRVVCPTGATEVLFAMTDVVGVGDGASWGHAVQLSDALSFAAGACPGLVAREVRVSAGEHVTEAGFHVPASVSVVGGFAGEGDLRLDGWSTVLSGDIGGDDARGELGRVEGWVGVNAPHVVVMGDGARLERVMVTGGDARGGPGGGVSVVGGRASLVEVLVTGNRADVGGGVAVVGGDVSVERSVIAGNVARSHGGGVSFDGAGASFESVVVSGNVATVGAGMWMGASDALLAFVDVTGNRATATAGGVYVDERAEAFVTGGIVYGNADASGDRYAANLRDVPGSDVRVERSIVEGWGASGATDMGGNMDVAPGFVTPLDPAMAPSVAGDFHLEVGSPAVDRGPVADASRMDMECFPRARDGDGDGVAQPDIGAFEADELRFDVAVSEMAPEMPERVEGGLDLRRGMLDGGSCSVGALGSSTPWLLLLAVGALALRRRR